MKIAVLGTGYVGLVAGAGFADFGHEVTCVDIDETRITKLRAGNVPFHEPGLSDLVRHNVQLRRLHFATDGTEAIGKAQIVIIAVGTPSLPDGRADLTQVNGAATLIGQSIRQFTVIVTKSTVPVGTNERLREAISKLTSQPFAIASNPEFLKQGNAVDDFLKPDRIVLGVEDERAIEPLRELYRGMFRLSDRIQIIDLRSAELAKYAANCMLANRISFMNELSRLCERAGADIDAIRKVIGTDARIGNKFLFAGAGFGGSCFPKDLRALAQIGREHGVELGVIEATERANESQKRVLGDRVLKHFGGSLDGKHVAVWGLSFKPDTDDTRESPAFVLIDQLKQSGARITAYDPEAMPQARRLLSDVELASDAYQAAEAADCLVLVTEWREFREPDLRRLRTLMRGNVLVDGRNQWSGAECRAAGFEYYGIGRGR